VKRKVSSKKLEESFGKLDKLYAKVPDTKGCLENLIEGHKCGAFCCQQNNPQVLYCEFMHALTHVLKHFGVEEIVELFHKSLINYLSTFPLKSCIFWDSETKMCKIHKVRPLSCYLYSVTPDEEFKAKQNRLKEIYKNELVFFRDQCNLVSTIDGSTITSKDTAKWWEELKEIELGIGITEKEITDRFGGTYLTFHDHLLIYLLPEYLFNNLISVRLHGNPAEKSRVIEAFSKVLTPVIEKLKNGN